MLTRIALLMLLLCPLIGFAGNVILITSGQTVDYEASADLSTGGQAHATALGEMLYATAIDRILATPYAGTRQTAAAISQTTGVAVTEFPRSDLANLAANLIKSGGTVVVVAWEADLRVLWRQLDLKANLTTPMNRHILLLRPDVPGLHALSIQVPIPALQE